MANCRHLTSDECSEHECPFVKTAPWVCNAAYRGNEPNNPRVKAIDLRDTRTCPNHSHVTNGGCYIHGIVPRVGFAPGELIRNNYGPKWYGVVESVQEDRGSNSFGHIIWATWRDTIVKALTDVGKSTNWRRASDVKLVAWHECARKTCDTKLYETEDEVRAMRVHVETSRGFSCTVCAKDKNK